MTQHGSYIGAQGFKSSVKHNVLSTFSFLDNVAILPSYVSPWARLWTCLAPFGTHFSSIPPSSLSSFLFLSITIPHWSSLKHLGPSGGHLGQIWCPLGSILVHFGQFWTHWGRTWNKIPYISNEAHENFAFWNFLKHRAPNVSQHE